MGQEQDKKGIAAKRSPAKRSGDGNGDAAMGSALRSVYQQTIDEKIPDDLLDLLGKLN